MFRARTGQVHVKIKQSNQEETKEENSEKQLRLPVHEEKETQRKNNCDKSIVLNKGNNAADES